MQDVQTAADAGCVDFDRWHGGQHLVAETCQEESLPALAMRAAVIEDIAKGLMPQQTLLEHEHEVPFAFETRWIALLHVHLHERFRFRIEGEVCPFGENRPWIHDALFSFRYLRLANIITPFPASHEHLA